MGVTVGIRREDKNHWERRVPLIPEHLRALAGEADLRFVVQPSELRVHADAEYREAGVEVSEDLSPADLIVAVKEVPTGLLLPGKSYLYFAHVIKGQPQNMPMLARLLELGCSLVDYEKIADDAGRRLVFFSRHAGYAGMLETLWCVGRRLQAEGVETPLAALRHAYEYPDLEDLLRHVGEVGEELGRGGLPAGVAPLVIGVAGYGNVAGGCREVLARLPAREVAVAELPQAASASGGAPIVTVELHEEHMVRPREAGHAFALQEYYQHPERYEGIFETHLPHLDVLVNTIYWDERYPRLVTRAWTEEAYAPGATPCLKVIGDISCDIAGGVELTLEVTEPDAPAFVYEVATGELRPGVEGRGPAVMAVDNLPSELPRASSRHFSESLREMVPALARADWTVPFAELDLPAHLRRAVIVYRGELTPAFSYLEEHLPG